MKKISYYYGDNHFRSNGSVSEAPYDRCDDLEDLCGIAGRLIETLGDKGILTEDEVREIIFGKYATTYWQAPESSNP